MFVAIILLAFGIFCLVMGYRLIKQFKSMSKAKTASLGILRQMFRDGETYSSVSFLVEITGRISPKIEGLLNGVTNPSYINNSNLSQGALQYFIVDTDDGNSILVNPEEASVTYTKPESTFTVAISKAQRVSTIQGVTLKGYLFPLNSPVYIVGELHFRNNDLVIEKPDRNQFIITNFKKKRFLNQCRITGWMSLIFGTIVTLLSAALLAINLLKMLRHMY